MGRDRRRGLRAASEVVLAVVGALALVALVGSPWIVGGLAVVAVAVGSTVRSRRRR